jgi:hypothetical protein
MPADAPGDNPFLAAPGGVVSSDFPFSIRGDALLSARMFVFENPPMTAFVSKFGAGGVFGLLALRRDGGGWELRHAEDREAGAGELRRIDLPAAREVAQFTAQGAFRPLKSAPNLTRGWRLPVATVGELGEALERLHPGAVADWFADAQGEAVPTGYRAFTARQSGMYRITTLLNDAQAAEVTRACCHESLCVKRRRWAAGTLGPDDAASKSAIPCLEPCALLLEFARTIARLTKDDAVPLPADGPKAAAMLRETEEALARADAGVREADFGAAENPRRLRWLREKLARIVAQAERPAA